MIDSFKNSLRNAGHSEQYIENLMSQPLPEEPEVEPDYESLWVNQYLSRWGELPPGYC